MSLLKERCEQVRDQVTIEQLFDALGWDLPQRGRIRCIWPDHEDRTPAMQVYRESNSVHCFACNKGGDVVEVAWKAGNPEGGEWELTDALDWLEETFGLQRLTPAKTLQSRLHKKLAKVRGTAPAAPDRGGVLTLVKEAFAKVEAKANGEQLVFASNLKDYVWSELDTPEVDLNAWATWARQIIYGSYAKTLYLIDFPLPPPPGLVDDRPETCRRAKLWELHRGTEYPSDWHLQLF